MLQLVQRDDVGNVLFRVDDAVGDEVNRADKFFPRAGHAADELDFLQYGAVNAGGDLIGQAVADHDDGSAGLGAVDAQVEGAFSADDFKGHVEAALRSLAHLVQDIGIVAVEEFVDEACFFGRSDFMVALLGHGDVGRARFLSQFGDHVADDARADDEDLIA